MYTYIPSLLGLPPPPYATPLGQQQSIGLRSLHQTAGSHTRGRAHTSIPISWCSPPQLLPLFKTFYFSSPAVLFHLNLQNIDHNRNSKQWLWWFHLWTHLWQRISSWATSAASGSGWRGGGEAFGWGSLFLLSVDPASDSLALSLCLCCTKGLPFSFRLLLVYQHPVFSINGGDSS